VIGAAGVGIAAASFGGSTLTSVPIHAKPPGLADTGKKPQAQPLVTDTMFDLFLVPTVGGVVVVLLPTGNRLFWGGLTFACLMGVQHTLASVVKAGQCRA